MDGRMRFLPWRVARGDMTLSTHLTREGAMRKMASVKRTLQEHLDRLPQTTELEGPRRNVERLIDTMRVERNR